MMYKTTGLTRFKPKKKKISERLVEIITQYQIGIYYKSLSV